MISKRIRWLPASALAATLAACGTITPTSPRPAPAVTVTRTPAPRIVVRDIPAPAVTVTRTAYVNGYPYISQDPSWNCAGGLWNAIIHGTATGSPQFLWAEYCPGVPQPAN